MLPFPGMRVLCVALLAFGCSGDPDSVAHNGSGGSSGTGGAPATLGVSITSPASNATVSGQVEIQLSVSGSPDSVSITANDQPVCTLTKAPWSCSFDTAPFHENTLPAPSHALDLGY